MAEDNLKELEKTYREIYIETDSQLWNDIEELVENGNWTAEKIKNTLMFSELKNSTDVMFMQKIEANVGKT